MKCEWLRRNDVCDRLVMVFAGWGSNAKLYQEIKTDGWDILVCSDFDDESFDESLLHGYSTIYLYAWSLGVYAASRLLRDIKLSAAFAINGTEWPCDDSRGIPEKIFKTTAATLSFDNLMRFRRRMFSSKDEFIKINSLLPEDPDIEKLRSQLEYVSSALTPGSGAGFWTRVYISDGDRIFPAGNQRKAWQNRNIEICEIKGGHYLNIAKIVRSTIPDKKIVGRKFKESLTTYDANASAQRLIVERLVAEIASSNPQHGQHVLEIGQGSGMSTLYFSRLLTPSEMDCVDLYETPHIDVAPVMKYYVEDAETLLNTTDKKWDYIVSSSAIQWFANIDMFFSNAARCLNDGGMLACSTFLPGNLSEFDQLRPSPMLYYKVDELLAIAKKYFRNVRVDSEEIRITFDSPREALRHLKLTGVGGSASHNISVNQLIEAIPIDENGKAYLTYRPAYIIASDLL